MCIVADRLPLYRLLFHQSGLSSRPGGFFFYCIHEGMLAVIQCDLLASGLLCKDFLLNIRL
jgi:hypothetical protein